MIPVDQTIFAGDPEGRKGDCFRACLASILELKSEEVPHFFELYGYGFSKQVKEWLKERYGISLVRVFIAKDRITVWGAEGYFIASGRSPRSTTEKPLEHAVVMLAEDNRISVAHDPHPSRAGLVDVQEYLLFTKAMLGKIETKG